MLLMKTIRCIVYLQCFVITVSSYASSDEQDGYGRTPVERMIHITNKVATNILYEHDFLHGNNIAFSPYGLTGILVALYEGVNGRSAYQIRKALGFPAVNDNTLREGFRYIHGRLTSYFVPKEGFLAGLVLNNENVTLKQEYKDILRRYRFDFGDIKSSDSSTNNTSDKTSTSAATTVSDMPSTTIMSSMMTTTVSTTTSTTTTTTTSTTEKQPPSTEESDDSSSSPVSQSTTTMKTTTTGQQSTPKPNDENGQTEYLSSIETTTNTPEELKTTTSTSIKSTFTSTTTTTSKPTTEISSTSPSEISSSSEMSPTMPSTIADMEETEISTVQSKLEEKETDAPKTSRATRTTSTAQTMSNTGAGSFISNNDKTKTTSSTTIETTKSTTPDPFENILGMTLPSTLPEDDEMNVVTDMTTIKLENRRKRQIVEYDYDDTTKNLINDVTPNSETEMIPMTNYEEQSSIPFTVENENTEKSSITTKLTSTTTPITNTPTTRTTTPTTTPTTTTPKPSENSILSGNTKHDEGFTPYMESATEETETSTIYNGARKKRSIYITTIKDTAIEVETETNQSEERKKRSMVFDQIPPFVYEPYPYWSSEARYYEYDDVYSMKSPQYFLAYGYEPVEVEFMKYDSILEFANIPALDAMALKLPLDTNEYYLLILLPKNERDAGTLIKQMKYTKELPLEDINNYLQHEYVRAWVPTFMLKGFVTLTGDLQKLGICDVFEPRQKDFTPMTNEKNIYVRNIEQAITVNIRKYREPNTKKRHIQRRPIEFAATHPFLFYVMDSKLHISLMSGKIMNPRNSRIQQ